MKLNLQSRKNKFLILSWALYDLSNQFFALNVVSLYFVLWLTEEMGAPEILYSLTFGISMFLVAILAPILGTISDLTNRRQPFLLWFTLISVVFTMILGVSGNILLGLLFFAIANFGCQMAIVFYNALIVNIAPKGKIGLISGFGRMFGYSGAFLALFLIKPIVVQSGYQAAFLPTGALFLIFSLPCLLFVKDKGPRADVLRDKERIKEKVIKIFRTLKATAFDTQKFPGLLNFLKASFFSLCAVNAVILFMSVYATRVFGLDKTEITNLIAFSVFFAMAGSIFSGFISDRIGYKRSLCLIFILWGISFLFAAIVTTAKFYWLIGALVGVALGSIWTVSRALAVKLVPEDKIGEVFGLFSLVGYFSAIAGAVYWGVIITFLAPLGALGYRITLSSLILFVFTGYIFLLRLPKDKR